MGKKVKVSPDVRGLIWKGYIYGATEMDKKRPRAAVRETAESAISNYNRVKARGRGKEWDREELSRFVQDAKRMLEAAGFKAA
jgi:hypothetical protein